jgi:hypothetical protein
LVLDITISLYQKYIILYLSNLYQEIFWVFKVPGLKLKRFTIETSFLRRLFLLQFWCSFWLDGECLQIKYTCLFYLCIDKAVIVVEKMMQGWGVDGSEWRWRKRLFVWEEEQLDECVSLLENITFFARKFVDKWVCLPDSPYIWLHYKIIWNKVASLKVLLFAWIAFNKRIPTKDNFFRRGVVLLDGMTCSEGREMDESINCVSYGAVFRAISGNSFIGG